MTTWERVAMAYDSRCDGCRCAIKRRSRAYLIGTRLVCLTCFAVTPEGKRVKRGQDARKRPMTTAEARYMKAKVNRH
jgi:hypothetical protein